MSVEATSGAAAQPVTDPAAVAPEEKTEEPAEAEKNWSAALVVDGTAVAKSDVENPDSDPTAGSFYDQSGAYYGAELRLSGKFAGVTAKLDAGVGKIFSMTQSAGFTKTGENADLLEASLEKCFGETFCVYGGKVLETVGAEIVGADNPHTVRSTNFGAVPFSMTGFGAKLVFDKVTLKAFVSLGADKVEDDNNSWNTALNGTFTVGEKTSGFFNIEGGPDLGDNFHQKIIVDGGLTRQISPTTTVTGYALSVAQQNPETNHWDVLRGVNAYLAYRPVDEGVGVNLRLGHTIRDTSSVVEGTAEAQEVRDDISQATVSLIYYINGTTQIRAEADVIAPWGGQAVPRGSLQALKTFSF